MSERAIVRASRLTSLLIAAAAIACTGTQRTGEDAGTVRVDTSTVAATPDTTSVQPGGTPAASQPRITAVVPDSVSVQRHSVKELLIRGTGFAAGSPGRNTVMIGPIRLTQVPANAAGTEIRVIIPDRVPSQSEAPPRPLFPGPYAVTVETAAGVSNAVNVQVLP